jgi:hypothetical protein
MNASVLEKAGPVAIVYHPEITVRTAYDLKPYQISTFPIAKLEDAYINDNFYDPHFGGMES